MCDFFSFITIPDKKKCLYFNWEQRKSMGLTNACDSHRHILMHYGVETDNFNAYEYNPLTKMFVVDAINGKDDSKQAKKWVSGIDWKTIVEPLIIKPIVNPFELPERTVTNDDIELLKQWAQVRATVGDRVGDTVRATVWDVGDRVGDTVRDTVWGTVGAYVSSFFDVVYPYDYSPAIKLWEQGLVLSFDGKTLRLHTGNDAHIVYEID
jgi:hypothetical protein